MQELKIRKLYVRFFDVDWDEISCSAIPIAKVRFASSQLPAHEIVPVVYLVNKALLKTNEGEISRLAFRILEQVNVLAKQNALTFKEMQLDCDWTDLSHHKYFLLLERIKSKLQLKHITLSATIRLHQVKYRQITGIPPVDRGMLMYYNMGKLTAEISPNSIYTPENAAKYIDYLKDYPLPLDVALPAFSWGIHIRNGKIIELFNNVNLKEYQTNPYFKPTDNRTFQAIQGFFFHGYYLKALDEVRMEEVSPDQCKQAALQLSGKLKKHVGSVAIFHLDSLILSHYETKDIEEVFTTFH